jgi:hypothetical protein
VRNGARAARRRSAAGAPAPSDTARSTRRPPRTAASRCSARRHCSLSSRPSRGRGVGRAAVAGGGAGARGRSRGVISVGVCDSF